ncbi:hypothetical protein [Pseudomonas sp. ER28]|uniref:hypothetical protein n=1 Tax=Pseudomonas sp. ER28 TaxID=3033801 RepID=UPI003F5BC46A
MLLGTGVLAALTRRNLTLPLATLAAMFGGAVCGHLFGDVLGMETLIAMASSNWRLGSSTAPAATSSDTAIRVSMPSTSPNR